MKKELSATVVAGSLPFYYSDILEIYAELSICVKQLMLWNRKQLY
jgi:hypothetical protein